MKDLIKRHINLLARKLLTLDIKKRKMLLKEIKKDV